MVMYGSVLSYDCFVGFYMVSTIPCGYFLFYSIIYSVLFSTLLYSTLLYSTLLYSNLYGYFLFCFILWLCFVRFYTGLFNSTYLCSILLYYIIFCPVLNTLLSQNWQSLWNCSETTAHFSTNSIQTAVKRTTDPEIFLKNSHAIMQMLLAGCIIPTLPVRDNRAACVLPYHTMN